MHSLSYGIPLAVCWKLFLIVYHFGGKMLFTGATETNWTNYLSAFPAENYFIIAVSNIGMADRKSWYTLQWNDSDE